MLFAINAFVNDDLPAPERPASSVRVPKNSFVSTLSTSLNPVSIPGICDISSSAISEKLTTDGISDSFGFVTALNSASGPAQYKYSFASLIWCLLPLASTYMSGMSATQTRHEPSLSRILSFIFLPGSSWSPQTIIFVH